MKFIPKILLFLSFFILFEEVSSQVLIDTTKEWSVLYRHRMSRTRSYKFTKDSLVDGYKYKELRYSFSEVFDPEHSRNAGLIREDGAAVYIRYHNGENYLLYDFSLNIHDTLDLGFLNGEINLQMTVDTISYWTVDSITRKVLHMRPLDATLTVPQLWVEGIGSTQGIVEVGSSQMFGNETALLCFKDRMRDTVLWQSTLGICYYTDVPTERMIVFEAQKDKDRHKRKTDRSGENETEDVPEQPETFTIQANLQQSGLKLKVYDEDGNLVENRIIKKDKDLKFDHLKTGEYLIQLTDSFDKIYATRKIKI